MSSTEAEQLEAKLSAELKHTLKLVPQSQRELFVFELARWYQNDRANQINAVLDRLKKQSKTIPVHSGTDALYPKEYIKAVPLTAIEGEGQKLKGLVSKEDL